MAFMRDQAAELRNLVRRSLHAPETGASEPPRLVIFLGGKGGVGTTTLAVNVAVTLAQLGKRVVLVDADRHRGDVALLCGLRERHSVADIMSGRRDVHEVLESGPGGIQIVPGAWAPGSRRDAAPAGQDRLLHQLQSLGRHAEVVIVDAGAGPGELAGRFWLAADQAILVTTADSVAIMDTYATIKVLASGGHAPPLRVAVNQVNETGAGQDVHGRIAQSCRRFLGLEAAGGPHVPLDGRVPASAAAAAPLVIASPTCEAAKAIGRLAAAVSAGAGRSLRPAV
jgi:flagellar biosynthesis protein FlhG